MSATGACAFERNAARWRYVVVAIVALASAAEATAAKNKAPVVSITSPSTAATFSAPATIAIVATATDADGTVARVDFYQGATLLGTRTEPPFAYTWTGVAAGSYSLAATATDNAGASKTSSAIGVTVTAPKIAIEQPAPGAVVHGTQAVVTGTFSGDAASTIVVDGPFGSRIASISGAGYSAYVPIVPGPNTLRATVARRNRTFDTATVDMIGNLDPLLTFVAPAAAAFEASATVPLEVDALSPAGAIARVDFFRGAILLGSATSPPYRYAWTNPPTGTHMVSAVATDDRGHTGTVSLPIMVSGPNVPPVVQLTSPLSTATFTAPATVAIAAIASDSDGSIAKVEFLRDGTVIGLTNVAPYSMAWTSVPAGTYTLAARATDDRSAMTLSPAVTVNVLPPNSPPSVSLTAPSDGATYTAPATVTLAANAQDSDGGVVRVEFLQGSTVVASSTSAPFTAAWSNVPAGEYTLTARATDTAGGTALSAPRSIVVVANAPPTVTITAPSSGANHFAPADLTLAATATDTDGTVASVAFYEGTTLIGTATSPPYTVRWSGVAAGSYTLSARAVDNVGASATSLSVPVTVTPPALVIESPLAGATINAEHAHVQGSVDAPSEAGVVVNGVIAAIEGGRFYAANVPLEPGANSLAATLTRLDGATTTRTIDVTSIPAPITISVGPAQGFAPLVATIVVSAQPAVGIAKVEIDADGTGTIDGTLVAPPWETTVSYLSSGTVNLVVRVTDTAGGVYTENVPIVVADKAALDQRVRAVWTGMTAALAAGDTSSALTFLDPLARQRYGPVFSLLQPDLGTIVGTFSNLQGVSLTQEFGEYAVNRVIDGQNRIFFIYFGRNGDGVWRLGSM
ncbi:MAG: Ig-like domain-containing protein [Burkholderiales bacterium]